VCWILGLSTWLTENKQIFTPAGDPTTVNVLYINGTEARALQSIPMTAEWKVPKLPKWKTLVAVEEEEKVVQELIMRKSMMIEDDEEVWMTCGCNRNKKNKKEQNFSNSRASVWEKKFKRGGKKMCDKKQQLLTQSAGRTYA
jgi:hypothetical protein